MSTIVSEAKLPIENGVGIVGVTVYDEDGVELVARSTANIVKIFTGDGFGIYTKKITIPDTELRGVCIWDDASLSASAKSFECLFTDAELTALKTFAVNTGGRTIDDLGTPVEATFEIGEQI